MANQKICDICKKNLADMSFKVKHSNKKWSFSNLWNDYETIDICNECGNKLLGIVNLSTMPPKSPPSPKTSLENLISIAQTNNDEQPTKPLDIEIMIGKKL